MILIDPKRIELNYYESIPHLLTPVVSSPKEASAVLAQRRHRDGAPLRAPLARCAPATCPRRTARSASAASRELPYLLVVIDELADLMMVTPAGRRGRDHPARAEVARGRHPPRARHAAAVGRRDHRHDQGERPVADRVRRLVADRLARDPRPNGAESLLGQGDMLFKPLGTSRLQRVQGAFVTEDEIALIVEQTPRASASRSSTRRSSRRRRSSPTTSTPTTASFDPDEDPLLDQRDRGRRARRRPRRCRCSSAACGSATRARAG